MPLINGGEAVVNESRNISLSIFLKLNHDVKIKMFSRLVELLAKRNIPIEYYNAETLHSLRAHGMFRPGLISLYDNQDFDYKLWVLCHEIGHANEKGMAKLWKDAQKITNLENNYIPETAQKYSKKIESRADFLLEKVSKKINDVTRFEIYVAIADNKDDERGAELKPSEDYADAYALRLIKFLTRKVKI